VSSSGVSRGITTSASLRWIQPGYMYPDESSRVLVYWFEGHNMLGWSVYIGLWKYIWLHDEIFLALAYPLLVWLPCMLFFYLCDDHQFIDGSKCERYSWSMSGSTEGGFTGENNTNEIWAQPHKTLTPLSTQNLKAMGLWVFILI